MSARLPNTEPERWRFIEQLTRQFEVDIQRLWRRMDILSTIGEGASDGGTLPSDYTAPTGGGTACANKRVLSIWGNPSAGTVTLSASGNAVTVNYNGTTSATSAAITAAAGYTVTVTGGTFPNNDQTITLPEGETLTVTSFSLARNGGFVPHARIDSCCGE